MNDASIRRLGGFRPAKSCLDYRAESNAIAGFTMSNSNIAPEIAE